MTSIIMGLVGKRVVVRDVVGEGRVGVLDA